MNLIQINEEINGLKTQLSQLNHDIDDFTDIVENEFSYVIQKYFGFNDIKTQLNTGGYSVSYIRFYMNDDMELKEVFSVQLVHVYNKLDLSYYSTSKLNEFELKRLMLLGKVSEVVLNKENDIINLFLTYIDKLKSFKDKYYNSSVLIDKKLTQLVSLRDALLKNNFSKVLKNGYTPTLPLQINSHKKIEVDAIKLVHETNTKYELEIQKGDSTERITVKKVYLSNIYINWVSTIN